MFLFNLGVGSSSDEDESDDDDDDVCIETKRKKLKASAVKSNAERYKPIYSFINIYNNLLIFNITWMNYDVLDEVIDEVGFIVAMHCLLIG